MTQKINYIKNSDELDANLKKAREKVGLTQKQASKIVNIERSSLSYYEIGRCLPSIFTLIRLAKIYHVTINSLITKE